MERDQKLGYRAPGNITSPPSPSTTPTVSKMVPSHIRKGKDDLTRQNIKAKRFKQLQEPVLQRGIGQYFVRKDVVGPEPTDK